MSLYDDPVSGLDASYAAVDVGQRNSLSAGGPADSNGLGSLADELAGAFGDYDEEEEEEEELGEGEQGLEGGDESYYLEGDSSFMTVETNGTSASAATPNGTSPSKSRRPPSASDYDGSDYGDPDDFVESGISFGLEDKLSQIERLALHSRVEMKATSSSHRTTSAGDDDGEFDDAGTVPRLMDGLQKLLPQSTLEAGSTRLITAHSALSSHMLHQTRTLRDLTFSINSSSLPPPETAELVLGLIDLIPRPDLQPLGELSTLHGLTLSLIGQLSFLSDSLHMARQSNMAASRKLRVAKEACADWKNELEMVEKARRWIEEGDWDARCRRREAAVVCKEVTGGFEDVCRGFEEKLAVAAAAAS